MSNINHWSRIGRQGMTRHPSEAKSNEDRNLMSAHGTSLGVSTLTLFFPWLPDVQSRSAHVWFCDSQDPPIRNHRQLDAVVAI